jgi:4-amino-4-deoxychorismate lyase
MSRLVETIRIEEGVAVNIRFHNERMHRTMLHLFSIETQADLLDILEVPADAKKGIFKCRVVYDTEIRKIEYLPYNIKPVTTLRLVDGKDLIYSYKFIDRKGIEKLMEKRAGCDEILIFKDGMVTDTSYSNVVLRDPDGNWITPSTCILAGTRRASLLESGLISEAAVGVNDLNYYSELRLINAMIGIEDTGGIPMKNIFC